MLTKTSKSSHCQESILTRNYRPQVYVSDALHHVNVRSQTPAANFLTDHPELRLPPHIHIFVQHAHGHNAINYRGGHPVRDDLL